MDMLNISYKHTVKKKIGILGGTFNPIHNGHLLLAENARENFSLHEILFIPSGCSYMKEDTGVADKFLRLEMTRLAIEDNPFYVISSLETERNGNSYTYETLLLLKEREPEAEYYFIVGADSLFSMEMWKHPEIIFNSCIILAAVREDKDISELERQITYLRNKYKANIRQLSLREINISATDIRKRIEQNKSIRYMVPDKVISYINKNKIYLRKEEQVK